MKSKKLVIGLSITAAVLFVVLLLTAGLVWYRTTHVFVEGEAYPLKAQSLDLREEDISFAHFDALQQLLPDCYILWNVPFQGQKVPSDSTELTVSSLSQEDLDTMVRYLPQLKAVNAGACQDYDMLEKLQEALPGLSLQYEVTLGSCAAAPDSEALVLEPDDYDYDTLAANLKHLPQVQSMQLKTPAISMEQVEVLHLYIYLYIQEELFCPLYLYKIPQD